MSLNYIIRHRRENKKKCTVNHLENDSRFCFYPYPVALNEEVVFGSDCVLLCLDGEELSEKDSNSSLILIDGTWRLAEKMIENIPQLQNIPRRILPANFRTAYPRRQQDCAKPSQGLASIEALYIAFDVMGRNKDSLLDNYYWKEQFLEANKSFFKI